MLILQRLNMGTCMALVVTTIDLARLNFPEG
jgi:hypothetical protein